MEAHPDAALVYGPVQMWNSWTGDPGAADGTQKYTSAVPLNTLIPPPAAMLAFLSNEQNEAVGVFVRREAIEDVGGYTDEAGFLYEDQALNVKLFLRYPLIVCDRNWYRYRQHPDSYSWVMRSRKTYEAGRLRFLEWVGKSLRRSWRERPGNLGRPSESPRTTTRGRSSREPVVPSAG